MPNLFFLYEQKSNIYHSIKASLRISTNKIQEKVQSDCYQITRPYPNKKFYKIIIIKQKTFKKIPKNLKVFRLLKQTTSSFATYDNRLQVK
jgi:hypothetical protein